MKIVYIGTVDMSYAILEKLISLKAQISGVVTRREAVMNADYKDLVPLCHLHDIPYTYADNLNENQLFVWLKDKAPDMIFCFGWSYLLKKDIIELPPKGILGFHPALLPVNRGRHPLIWTLVLGLKEAGSSFFFMDEGVDSGDLISQRKIFVEYEDTAATLYEKVKSTVVEQVEEFFPDLNNGTIQRIPQNQSKASYWRKRTISDGKIDFRMSSRAVYNLVRGLTQPYPGAHIEFKGSLVKIWQVKEIKSRITNIEPGRVIKVDTSGIEVKCYTNAVRIVEHEFKELPDVGDYL